MRYRIRIKNNNELRMLMKILKFDSITKAQLQEHLLIEKANYQIYVDDNRIVEYFCSCVCEDNNCSATSRGGCDIRNSRTPIKSLKIMLSILRKHKLDRIL